MLTRRDSRGGLLLVRGQPTATSPDNGPRTGDREGTGPSGTEQPISRDPRDTHLVGLVATEHMVCVTVLAGIEAYVTLPALLAPTPEYEDRGQPRLHLGPEL